MSELDRASELFGVSAEEGSDADFAAIFGGDTADAIQPKNRVQQLPQAA